MAYDSYDFFRQIGGFTERVQSIRGLRNVRREIMGAKSHRERAPKALADVFEALVAAVYLDCECDIQVVFSVFMPVVLLGMDELDEEESEEEQPGAKEDDKKVEKEEEEEEEILHSVSGLELLQKIFEPEKFGDKEGEAKAEKQETDSWW